MDLIKDIGKSLNFKERYDDLDRTGMEEYDREECKELRELEASGAPLSESQKETLHYCNTIRGERTRAAMNLGTSAAKVGVGLATSNPNLVASGITDAGGYVMSEAQEVGGPNDGVGQEIGKQDYMNLGTDILSGVGAAVAGKQAAEVGGDETSGNSMMDMIASGGVPEGSFQDQSNTAERIAELERKLAMLTQNTSGVPLRTDGPRVENTHGSKLKRSTRQHDYIKGNTRGYR